MEAELNRHMAALLQKIRNEKPLVLNITNTVSSDLVANALLALGASPVMAHAREEMETLASQAACVCLNIGTLDPALVDSQLLAARHAQQAILDPVGVGASPFRKQACQDLLAVPSLKILKGNFAEIKTLAYLQGWTEATSAISKGVDSMEEGDHRAAEALCKSFSHRPMIVIQTGRVDYLVSNEDRFAIWNGSEAMRYVTGMGCACTALIAACVACAPQNPVMASLCGLLLSGIAGEMAEAAHLGPGSFRVHYLDALFKIDSEIFLRRARWESCRK